MMATKISEDQLQAQCVEWFRLQYPERLIFSIPNGGSRNVIEATKLKRCGVLPGVPDLCVAHARGNYHGMFIELKVDKNKCSAKQLEVMDKLDNEKYFICVAYTFEDFVKMIKYYFSIEQQEKKDDQ